MEDLMEALGEAEQETTLGLVAKEFTETNKAHKTMFQVRVQLLFQLSLSQVFFAVAVFRKVDPQGSALIGLSWMGSITQ